MMKSLLLTGCLFILLLQLPRIKGEQSYVVVNDEVSSKDGDDITIADFSKVSTIGKERYFNGTITLTEDLNDEEYAFAAEFWSSPYGDSEYKKMAMEIPKTGFCEGMKKFFAPIVQPALIQGENTDFPNIPDDGLCPIPAGTYFIKAIEFNTENWPSHLPKGLIKTILRIFKNDDAVGELTLIIKIQDPDD